MALCLTQWKDGINTVSNCVWQQFIHNFTYILCINSKFATSRPSKFEFIIIYLGKPLVQARTFILNIVGNVALLIGEYIMHTC